MCRGGGQYIHDCVWPSGNGKKKAQYGTYVHTRLLSVQTQRVPYGAADGEFSYSRKYAQASLDTTTAPLHLPRSPRAQASSPSAVPHPIPARSATAIIRCIQ